MNQGLGLAGLLALYTAGGATAATQERNLVPIVVPFEKAPSPYIVIRVPLASGFCEALIFDTGTNTTVLASALASRVGLSVGHQAGVESLNGVAPAIKGEVRGIGFEGVPAVGPRVAIATNIAGLHGFGRSMAGLYGHNWLTGTDYLIDYDARRIVMGAAGTLPRSNGGHQTSLSWAAGRPAVEAMVRAHSGEPFSARLVLDSGADHVTLFGGAAVRIALVAGWDQTMMIDSGFGTREVPATVARVNVGGRERSVSVEVRKDVTDREEDGLLPTSLFRSVLVSSADGNVLFDASLALSKDLQRTTSCATGSRHHGTGHLKSPL